MTQEVLFRPEEVSPGVFWQCHRCPTADIAVVQSGEDYRLAALRPYAAEEKLFSLTGSIWPHPTRHSIQVDTDTHLDAPAHHDFRSLLDGYYWRFLNHSCNPTALVRGREVFAARPIKAWDEINFHYATTEYQMASPFACHCAQPNCLQTVRGYKHLTDDQRAALAPWVAPHVRLLEQRHRVHQPSLPQLAQA